MTDALEDQEGTVSTGGRTITDLRFADNNNTGNSYSAYPVAQSADDIDGFAGEEEELAKLVEHLDKTSTAYGMEISAGRPR